MVSNIGKITNLAGTPSTGLVDGSDKLHSGILKVLESFSQGDMCISHAGFTITGAGSHTQYNLAQPIKFLKKGELVTHTVTLVEPYTGTTQDASHTRYDWVLINPATPELVIVQGTAASTPTVADITAGHIPIALVEITTTDPLDNDKADYSFQTYTMNVVKNSVSIGYDDSGYTEALSITASAGDTTIENKVSDKDIIFKVNDGGTAREILRLDADDNEVRIVSTIDSTGMGPQLTLFRDTPDASNNDLIGVISFKGENSTNAETEYIRLVGQIIDETNGSEDAQFFIRMLVGGTLSYPLKMTPTQTIFNAANEDIDVRIDGAADNLFYADSSANKIGIGTNSPDAPLHVVSTDDGETLRLESTDSDAGLAPDLIFKRTSTSPAIGDNLGNIRFLGTNINDEAPGDSSIKAEHEFADIYARANDVTLDTEDGELYFRTFLAGTQRRRLDLTPTEAAFNEDGQDINFRAEGVGQTHALFVQGSDGKVGIRNNSPSAILDVTGSIASSSTITATTSVSSAAIVGSTSVTGAIVTSNGQLETMGQRKTMYEMVEQTVLPVPSFNHHIIYVDDISNIGPAGLAIPGQVNNQVILPAPTDMMEFKIINTHAANPITIVPSAGTINIGRTTHAYIGSANVITLAPSQGVHLQAVNDSQPPLQTGWMITGIAGL